MELCLLDGEQRWLMTDILGMMTDLDTAHSNLGRDKTIRDSNAESYKQAQVGCMCIVDVNLWAGCKRAVYASPLTGISTSTCGRQRTG